MEKAWRHVEKRDKYNPILPAVLLALLFFMVALFTSYNIGVEVGKRSITQGIEVSL